jgi:hypothetical protein
LRHHSQFSQQNFQRLIPSGCQHIVMSANSQSSFGTLLWQRDDEQVILWRSIAF